jgi:hypothetical protein
MLAAKHVQRQIAVGIVVAVKEATLLLAVQRVACGVKVQHQFSGFAAKVCIATSWPRAGWSFKSSQPSASPYTRWCSMSTTDQQGVARTDHAACRCMAQAQLAIGGLQQHDPGIAGHASAVKAAFYNASANAHAQIIGGITVTPQVVKLGEAVTVTATVDVGSSNYCGFIVFYGDGTSAGSFSDYTKPGPFVTTHTYAKPGE